MPGHPRGSYGWEVRRFQRTGPATVGVIIILVMVLDGTGMAARFPSIDIGRPAVEIAPSIESVRYDGELTSVADYLVTDTTIASPDGIAPTPTHEALWALVTDVLPSRYLWRIRQFSIVSEHPYDVVAIVHQSVRDPDRWILTMDEADADHQAVLVDTIIHELAHLITLDDRSFTFSTDEVCAGTQIPVGCAAEGSLMDRWTDRFWPEPFDPATPAPDAFVTTYASSAPQEDFAETFMVWVREGTSEADTIVGAKFRFLDAEPELVALRAELSASLMTEQVG